jgi:hypothetical protein
MIRVMYEIDFLIPLAGLCAEVVGTGDLTEQVVAAISIASSRWGWLIATVLVPQVVLRGCLVVSQILSEVHDRVGTHVN